MSAITILSEELSAISPAEIVEQQKVETKFVRMYDNIHGAGRGRIAYEKESFNFRKIVQENQELAKCSPMSLFGCFLDMAVNGLSLDPTGRPHCYMIPRSVKTGHKDQKGKEIYEKRAVLSITGYGELVMRQRAGQIKYVDSPIIVYEGDTFRIGYEKNKPKITYSAEVPRRSNKAIAAFIRIVRADGSEDFKVMQQLDIERLKGYSERGNRIWDNNLRKYVPGDANKLYTSQEGGIDSGFLESKMIKHAFDTYPKVRIGKFSRLETEDEPQDVDYDIEDAEAEEVPQSFCDDDDDQATAPEQAGITVEPEPEEEEIGF